MRHTPISSFEPSRRGQSWIRSCLVGQRVAATWQTCRRDVKKLGPFSLPLRNRRRSMPSRAVDGGRVAERAAVARGGGPLWLHWCYSRLALPAWLHRVVLAHASRAPF